MAMPYLILNMLKKIFLVSVLGLHFFMILCININHFIGDLKTVTLSQEVSGFENFIARITSSDVFTTFSTYTGSNSSYGFYAPSVGSEFMMSFKILDSSNNIIGVHNGPELQQDESKLRFELCTLPVQEKLLNPNSIANDYTKIMMHQISSYLKNGYKNSNWVAANIYVYKYPTKEEYLNYKGPRNVVEVARYNFKKFR